MHRQEFMYKLYHYSSYLNYIIWIFEVNALMLVLNAPLIFAAIGFRLSVTTLLLYVVCTLPAGPALYAGLSALAHADTNNGVVKSFFRALKEKGLTILKWSAIPIGVIDPHRAKRDGLDPGDRSTPMPDWKSGDAP